jgi:ribonucleoside-diphosphate reductase beta chain
MEEATQTGPSRATREDFRATSDPALQEGGRADVKLLDYTQLYNLWEKQQWLTQDLDFSQDRIDWHERIPEEERFQRMYGLSSFFIGEQKVADELGPIMRAAPTEAQRIFLSTQIADEARHVRFFDRFFAEVGVLEGADELAQRLAALDEHLNDAFRTLFDDLLKSRVDRLGQEPGDRDALVEAVTLYHMVIEGMLALTGQHFIIDYNERMGTLPGFVEGFSNVARDEHRHIAFGVRFLRDVCEERPEMREVILRTLTGLLPEAARVFCPPQVDDASDFVSYDYHSSQVYGFAYNALKRRMDVIGVEIPQPEELMPGPINPNGLDAAIELPVDLAPIRV